jgi:organic hydroperoxide reductase OsmC/OhrA
MLTFLWVASRNGLDVASYEDDAIGTMTKNERGIPWVSSVVLRPRVVYSGPHPTSEVEEELHHQAHEACYIANSVKTQITVDRQLR